MTREGRRSLGSNGDVAGQTGDVTNSADEGKAKVTTIVRVLTVVAYIISVSTAAALLSAYYVFLWVPHPSDPLQQRPTDSPFSLAQHGAGSTFYHYPKNHYANPSDSGKLMPPNRSKKSHYKTTLPPNFLPKPQYLVRRKGSTSKRSLAIGGNLNDPRDC